MDSEKIKELLSQVKDGQLDIDAAVKKLRHLPFEDMGFARIDHHRQIRCGFPEVIYCPGKTTDEIIQIFNKLAKTGNNVLATRADRDVYKALMDDGNWPDTQYHERPRAITLEQKHVELKAGVTIVSAGTADGPIAQEAAITAKMMGQKVELICDVGVAGLHRLLGQTQTLQKANVIVVVAGMEGALASVVGGLVDCPVIAVPTSIGYGASFNGLAALLAMLNSCASGVTVVNIDNGFGAGYTASLINEKIHGKK
jgi:NCAIR mutase (PurE)-related protein